MKKNLIIFMLIISSYVIQAQIVHQAYNPYFSFNENEEIDINNDGVIDLKFFLDIAFIGNSFKVEGTDDCYFGVISDHIKTLNIGDTVSANSFVYTKDLKIFCTDDEATIDSNTNRYFGFKLIENSNTYYGWMRYSFDWPYIHLKDYCINTNIDGLIVVGDSIPQVVENIKIQDVNNYFDGRDLQISCSKPFNETNIIEYRGYILKEISASNFNVLEAINNVNFFGTYNVQSLPNNIILNSNSVDTDGDTITNLVNYNCAFLTLVENGLDTNYYLSGFSNTLRITSPLMPINSIKILDIGNDNNSSDIEFLYSPWNSNNGVVKQKLFFSDRNLNVNLTIEDLISSENYINISLTDTLQHFLDSDLSDYNNNLINEGIVYDVYLLSMPDSTTFDVAAFKKMEGAFVLTNPNLFYTNDTNYNGFVYVELDTLLTLSYYHNYLNYKFDIDSNNVDDLSIICEYQTIGMGAIYSEISKIIALNNNEVLEFEHLFVEDKYQYNSTLNWTNSQQIIRKYSSSLGVVEVDINSGLSINKRFLPFRVFSQNDTLIGYIEIVPYGSRYMHVLGYGYYKSENSSVSDLIKCNIELYPNPAKTRIYVKAHFYTNATIKLIDSLGKQVYSSNFNSETEINTSNLQAGIYLLKITSEEKVLVEKIIIQ